MPKTWSSRHRFLYTSNGHWYWQVHGQTSKKFSSEQLALDDLRKKLDVPAKALLKNNPQQIIKKASIPGVAWHSRKLGFVCKSGAGGSHFTEKEAAKQLHESGAVVQDRVGRPSNKRTWDMTSEPVFTFKHVYWHKAKTRLS